MVRKQKYVELTVACLQIQKIEILKGFIFSLRLNEIQSVVCLVDC